MNICPVGEDSHLGEMSVPFVPAQRSMGLCVSTKFNGKLVGHSRLSHVHYGIVTI